jgi:hypothetical protein
MIHRQYWNGLKKNRPIEEIFVEELQMKLIYFAPCETITGAFSRANRALPNKELKAYARRLLYNELQHIQSIENYLKDVGIPFEPSPLPMQEIKQILRGAAYRLYLVTCFGMPKSLAPLKIISQLGRFTFLYRDEDFQYLFKKIESYSSNEISFKDFRKLLHHMKKEMIQNTFGNKL